MRFLASRNLALVALVITLLGFVLQSLGSQLEGTGVENVGLAVIVLGIFTWLVSRVARSLHRPPGSPPGDSGS